MKNYLRFTNLQSTIWLRSLLVAVLASCSNIGENERLLVVNVVERDTIAKPDTIPTDTIGSDTIDYFQSFERNVLIEDFTGQDCVNCPDATELIAELQEMYGHDRIVAVGIHSGPLGVKPSKDPEGLATDLGDTYYNYWAIEMQPYGVIDRSDGTLATEWWTAKVEWDLSHEQSSPSVNIWVKATRSSIEVTLAAFEHFKGKLQLWIVEDGVVGFQKMHDGTTKHDYVHNHVLRGAVNGDWGEDVTMEYEDLKTFNYSYTIPEGWNTDNLYIVAFAYNDDKVVQVVRAPILK